MKCEGSLQVSFLTVFNMFLISFDVSLNLAPKQNIDLVYNQEVNKITGLVNSRLFKKSDKPSLVIARYVIYSRQCTIFIRKACAHPYMSFLYTVIFYENKVHCH